MTKHSPHPEPAPVPDRRWRHSLGDPESGPARFRSGLDLLRGADLFSPVTDGELAKFAALGHELRVDKGAFIPGVRAETSSLGMLLEGHAVLSWRQGREELLLRELEPGDMLGEGEVFEDFPFDRDGSGDAGIRARATSPVLVMAWDRDAVIEALRRWPDVSLSLLGGMARRQRDLQRRVAGLSNQRAPRRLARALVALADDRGVRVRAADGTARLLLRRAPSRTRLGELAGMARETASRLLARWERSGWIADRDGDLLVTDEAQLRRVAGSGA